MKLEMTLKENPGLLHAVPVLNVLLLLLIFIVLGPSLVSQSGVAVELPVSRFHMETQSASTVISVTEGDPPGYWLGRKSVSATELELSLDRLRAAGGVTAVLLQVDRAVSVAEQRRVAEMALQKGFTVYLMGKNAEVIEGEGDGP